MSDSGDFLSGTFVAIVRNMMSMRVGDVNKRMGKGILVVENAVDSIDQR